MTVAEVLANCAAVGCEPLPGPVRWLLGVAVTCGLLLYLFAWWSGRGRR